MKKAIALFLVVLMASLILPISNLLEYLTRTPSEGWSNEFVLADYDDYAMRRFFPSKILQVDDSHFIALAFEGTKLHVQKYNELSELIGASDIELGTDTVWMLDASLIDDQTIGVYYREEKNLNFGRIDTDTLQLDRSVNVSEGDMGLSASDQYAVTHDGTEIRIFKSGELIDQWEVGRIKSLGAVHDEGKLTIITNIGVSGSYKGVYTSYDVATKSITESIIFEPENSLAFGDVKDVVITDDGIAIMYSKTVIEQGVAYGVISYVLMDDSNVIHVESYKDAALQKAGLILDATPDNFEVVSLIDVSGNVDFVKWNTDKGYRQGTRLTNTKQTGLNPEYLTLGGAEYLLWFDLTTSGKELKLSSNQQKLVDISMKPSKNDYWTIPYIIILAGAFPVLITTFIPLFMFDLILIGIAHLINQQLRKVDKKLIGVGVYLGGIHVVYLLMVLYMSMIKQLKGYTFADILVSHDLFAGVVYALIIGASGLIALFANTHTDGNRKLTWFAYFAAVSTFFLAINFGIYSVIEIMSVKF
ncbi:MULTISPECIES: hypothetical protein [unclassified Fusibacter]|uniref:hypothetical protein n=1 Tax=unclassified Fusibacter TaxID=2624464 RepID=UPI001012A745|nr:MULTISPECIES: hypothetical protein [unclassified Fusibacter]MCK8059320.1 hypothetical protein [Fusibacter sp. A2]NPE21216.1 hypothetical protein [Fusibacter sp. A1]RXV62484.1 hypothetical protein DWB64_05220 [Fusibacter sp. A1]